MRFADIIGQEGIKKYLVRCVEENRIPHAQLLWGGEGTGKLGLAIAYAQYLNCEHRENGDSCGKCPSCIQISKLTHPDLHFAFPIVKKASKKDTPTCNEYMTEWREAILESHYLSLPRWMSMIADDSKMGTIYSAESQEILRKLSTKSYESTYKVMIIWLPERMQEVGSNKLLKLIEEPPANTVILMVSEQPEQLLSTIVSRSQPIHIPPISIDCMTQIFGKEVARIAAGNYIKAIEVQTDDENTKYKMQVYRNLMLCATKRNLSQLKNISEEIVAQGREFLKGFLEYAQKITRESFIANLMNQDLNYMCEPEEAFVTRFKTFITEENIENITDIFAKASKEIAQNGNGKIIIFDMGLQLMTQIKRT